LNSLFFKEIIQKANEHKQNGPMLLVIRKIHASTNQITIKFHFTFWNSYNQRKQAITNVSVD
jgi:hypothetical protein